MGTKTTNCDKDAISIDNVYTPSIRMTFSLSPKNHNRFHSRDKSNQPKNGEGYSVSQPFIGFVKYNASITVLSLLINS